MKVICFNSDLKNDDGSIRKNVFRVLNCDNKKLLPKDAKNITAMDSDGLPQDRYFRNAWKLEKEKINIDKDKAVDIHINKLRPVRDGKLKLLDIETTKATQKKDSKLLDEIAAQAQELRDMPVSTKKELEKIKDFDVIKTYMPECLQ